MYIYKENGSITWGYDLLAWHLDRFIDATTALTLPSFFSPFGRDCPNRIKVACGRDANRSRCRNDARRMPSHEESSLCVCLYFFFVCRHFSREPIGISYV